MPSQVIRSAVRAAITKAGAVKSERLHGALLASLLGIASPAHAQDSRSMQGQPSTSTNSDDALEEIVVSSIRFKSVEPVSALKLPVAIKDTPQSIMAITADVIDFASIKSFQDVYKIDASGGTSHSVDSFPRNYYRGFFKRQDNNAIRIDGFRWPADLQLDLEPYERFEIVKGPVSTLYGQNSIGGVLNAISKEPRDEFGGHLSLEGGSFSHGRATADVYGPLGGEKVQYRVVGAWTDEDSFLDQSFKKVKLIAPTMKLELSDATSIVLRANWQMHDFRYHFGNGVQFIGTDRSQAQPGDFVMPDIERSVFFGQAWNTAEKDAQFGQLALQHRFANDWHLRIGGQYNHVDEYSANDSEQAPLANGDTIYGSLYTNEKEDTLYAGEVQLYGDIELLGKRTTLYFGADYQDHEATFLQGIESVVTGFNIFAPRYDLVPPRFDVFDYPNIINNINTVKEYGATAQIFLRPTDQLTLSVGARYSNVELASDRKASFGTPGLDRTAFAAIPFTLFESSTSDTTLQGGITYAVTPNVNLYASYGETFEPQIAVFLFDPSNPLGRRAPPEEGRAYEVGLKGEFLDKRVSASVAAFDMERSNLTQPRPGTNLQEVLGTQTSKGVEIELQGAVTSAFNVFLTLAAMDPKYEGGRFDGLQSANGAKVGLSSFLSYEIQEGALRGLGVGGGVVHKRGREFFGADRRYANGDFVVFDFGSFTEVDARIFYNSARWRFQLSGTNLFDEKYYSPPRDVLGFGVHVNPPRAVNLKVVRNFGNGS